MTHHLNEAPHGAAARQGPARDERGLPTKWQMLGVVEELREVLGLRGTSIAVLRAMVALIPGDRIDRGRADGHICFASNATLARRAHVSVQTVERHIARLISEGLVTRRASGNGKRWARRDRQGRVVLAAGLSLAPLAERHAELVAKAAEEAERRQGLALLRDRCALALAELRALCGADQCAALLNRARNLLRRKPEDGALNGLLEDISREINRLGGHAPEETRASDTRIEGHKETDSRQYVEEETSSKMDVSERDMQRAYPRLCKALRFARSQRDCAEIMDQLAAEVGLAPLWPQIRALGAAQSFMVLGYVYERAGTIGKPAAYANRLLAGLREGVIGWESLLRRGRGARAGG